MTEKKGEDTTVYSKNHRTIYVNTEEWDSIKFASAGQGRSVSNYLVNLHSEHIVRTVRLSSGIGDAGKSAAGPDPDRQPQLEKEVVQPEPGSQEALNAIQDDGQPEESDSDTKIKVSKTVEDAAKDLAKLLPKTNLAAKDFFKPNPKGGKKKGAK